MAELAPCPFCAVGPVKVGRVPGPVSPYRAWCTWCAALGPVRDKPEWATDAWNERQPTPLDPTLAAAIRETAEWIEGAAFIYGYLDLPGQAGESDYQDVCVARATLARLLEGAP